MFVLCCVCVCVVLCLCCVVCVFVTPDGLLNWAEERGPSAMPFRDLPLKTDTYPPKDTRTILFFVGSVANMVSSQSKVKSRTSSIPREMRNVERIVYNDPPTQIQIRYLSVRINVNLDWKMHFRFYFKEILFSHTITHTHTYTNTHTHTQRDTQLPPSSVAFWPFVR